MRDLHRDLGYFFVGLILSFSISGIAMNHRKDWNPSEYVVIEQNIPLQQSLKGDALDKNAVKAFFGEQPLLGEFRSYRVRGDKLKVYYEQGDIVYEFGASEAKLEGIKKRPLLGDMVTLHKSTHSAWVWYSDIFALVIIFLAISGLTLSKGKRSFSSRGWKLATLGLCPPLIFLAFLL